MSFYRIFSKVYKRAGQKICRDCATFIDKESKILDLGCGSAIVGKAFKDYFQAKVVGADIKDLRVNELPFVEFNGRELPFLDNCFDVTLLNYVLHHTSDPTALLKEAKRVTKDKIIIQEDLPDNILSRIYCKVHGFFFDRLLGNPNKSLFRSEKDWHKTWKELGMEVVFEKQVSPVIIRKLFILN